MNKTKTRTKTKTKTRTVKETIKETVTVKYSNKVLAIAEKVYINQQLDDLLKKITLVQANINDKLLNEKIKNIKNQLIECKPVSKSADVIALKK